MKLVSLFVFGVLAVGACTVNSTTNSSGNTCNTDSSVSCPSGDTGYSCSGSDTPSQDFSNIACGAGVAGGAGTAYCCTTGATCSADSTVQCPGGGSGYSCTGSDTPDQDDSSLSCSTGTPNDGVTSYCCCTGGSDCTSGDDGGTGDGGNSCVQSSSVTCEAGQGWSCQGTDMPAGVDASLNCSGGTSDGNGGMNYCCTD
jgi:hypothetical protein